VSQASRRHPTLRVALHESKAYLRPLEDKAIRAKRESVSRSDRTASLKGDSTHAASARQQDDLKSLSIESLGAMILSSPENVTS